MAQKREKEETELKVPESLPLCSLTSPPPQHLSATSAADISDLNLNDSRSNSVASPELTDPKVSSTTEDSRPNSASSSISRSSSATSPEITDLKLSGEARSSSAKSPESVDLVDRRAAVKRPRESTRCSGMGCRRKVGLIPFRCRCGEVYCSEHRYSDRHECSYDYKAAGREAIARENPVVKAAKILRV